MPDSRKRQPSATRRRLLQAGFREIYRNGFASSDLESILRIAGVTKGALYHHFQSKKGLAYAVVDEVLSTWILERWLRPVQSSEDPISAIQELLAWSVRHSNEESLALGCPLNNLSQELASKDAGFRRRLARIYQDWRDGLESAFEQAQSRGQIRNDVDCKAAATFLVAAWAGSIGLAKTDRDVATVGSCKQGIEAYLEGLRHQDGLNP